MMNCSSNGNLQSPIIHNRFSCGLKLSSLGLRYFGAERSFEWKVASQLRLRSRIAVYNREIGAVDPDRGLNQSSPWDEKPFELRPSGRRAYLDEQDVVTLLDPPKELIPLDPAAYNPAAYLWKKIEDIPEERRHRLLNLLKPSLISRLWEIAGTRYEDSKLAKKSASKLLSTNNSLMSPEFWICRSSGGIHIAALLHMAATAMYHLLCSILATDQSLFVGLRASRRLYFVARMAKHMEGYLLVICLDGEKVMIVCSHPF